MYCCFLLSLSPIMDYFPHKVELESDFFSFSLPPEPQDSIITVYLGLSVCKMLLCIFLQ